MRQWLHNRLYIMALMATLSASVMAQQRPEHFEFGHIGEQEGLSFKIITALLHDRDGFLWVGTNNGLNRYDGSHFVRFRHQRNKRKSLLNNQLYALCEDRQGRIWATFENGISCYDKATGQFHNITSIDNRPLGICKNIRCDRAGNIWFTSRDRGLFRYVVKTGAINYAICYPTDSTGGVRTIPNGLVEDPYQAGFWIATKQGLRYYDIARRQYTTTRLNPRRLPIFTDHEINALAIDGDRLLVSDVTDLCIIVYDLRRQQIVKRLTNASQQGTGFQGACIVADRQHNLWVSTWDYKAFFIDARTDQITQLSQVSTKPTALGADFFWGGWQHPDGTILLGTTNGLAHTNPERALYDIYNLEALFPALSDERGVISFAEDPDGSWWLGTSIRGLLHYTPTTNRLEVYRLPHTSGQYPWGLPITGLSLHGNELLIGSDTAIYRFDKQRHQFNQIRLPVSINRHLFTAFCLKDNTYWVFGNGKLALAYDLPRQKWQTFPIQSVSKDPHFFVRRSLINRQGQLWLDIYPEGFARFSPETAHFVVTDRRQADYEGTIYSLAEGGNGSFLMATTMHGLVQYDPLKQRALIAPENESMVLSQCTAALPDRFDNTWVANLNLLSVITKAKKQVLNFRLPINEPTGCTYSSYLFPLRNGHILSAQRGHLVEFRPENLRLPNTRETVLLNRLVLPDTALVLCNTTPAIRLAAEDNSFSVEYSVLSAISRYHYLYRLEGSDEDWKDVGATTTAVYNRLPGGNYVFAVKAVSLEGVETAVRRLPIHIDTLFYRTNWFWALFGLGMIGLLLGFFRFRTKQAAQIYRLQMQATRLERDKTQIQYQNLINHLNPHFLFNSLTSLNSLIVSSPREASTFLRKLSIIYRYILQNKDKELVTLDEELAFVQHYTDLQTTRFEGGICFEIAVPETDRHRRIVPVTLQNLFENAIKHNTLSDESPLVIRVYTEADDLIVTNNLQRKRFVETSNKQGLASLQSLYRYLNRRPVTISETATTFMVRVPLL